MFVSPVNVARPTPATMQVHFGKRLFATPQHVQVAEQGFHSENSNFIAAFDDLFGDDPDFGKLGSGFETVNPETGNSSAYARITMADGSRFNLETTTVRKGTDISQIRILLEGAEGKLLLEFNPQHPWAVTASIYNFAMPASATFISLPHATEDEQRMLRVFHDEFLPLSPSAPLLKRAKAPKRRLLPFLPF